ncbi:MAG TPA: adenylate/guanylate cyclase domain-containing protein [Paucimonas sp.]|nr:adenylate/guanylate cyclase domain-containing protein [Paucimonas sp.]
MSDRNPELKQLNRTFIGSVLFIDIVGYSTRSVQEQLEIKEVFNAFITDAMQNVAVAERIMVDTGDGAAIAFLGDPEDALFAALSLRDAIDTAKLEMGEPGFVRMGINLGPLKIVRDINGHTNMIGDGVNDAQRVMSFAEPGQVMVSHSYYDIISRFSRDYAQLFVYEGTRHDKHVREHEVYRFGPAVETHDLTEKLRDRSRARSVDAHQASPAPRHAGWARDKVREVAVPLRRAVLTRTGMIAAGLGALTIVGAVWSWTSTPSKQPDAPKIAAQISAPTAEPDSAIDASKATAPSSSTAVAASKPAPMASAASAGSTASAPASSAPIVTAVADSVRGDEKPAEKTKASAEQSAPAAKPGTVKLAIQPWGEIYVDGSKRGVSPPLKSLKLAPGKHQIEVRNGQFAPYKTTVEVKSNAEATVQYAF